MKNTTAENTDPTKSNDDSEYKVAWARYCAASKAIAALTEMGKMYISTGDSGAALRIEHHIVELGKLEKAAELTAKPTVQKTAKTLPKKKTSRRARTSK